METKKEIKLLQAFSKLWKESNNQPETLPEEEIFYISSCNVYGIVLKTQEAKNIFKRFIDKDNIGRYEKPKLDYTNKGLESTSTYNIDILSKILKCFDATEEKIKMSVIKDYPLLLEGEHFNFILAPRVD